MALTSVAIDRLAISRVADGLGASWHTGNDAVLAAGCALLIDDRTRSDGVRVLGVDEHCWRHTRHGRRFVAVIIDLTAVHDGTGLARSLDMVPGRSKAVLTTWLQVQSAVFRAGVETVAMDGFTGDTCAAAEALPNAAGNACSRRIAGTAAGPGTRSTRNYRVLCTGTGLSTDRQHQRLEAVCADEDHVQVEVTWGIFQRIVADYGHPYRAAGKAALAAVGDALSPRCPTSPERTQHPRTHPAPMGR